MKIENGISVGVKSFSYSSFSIINFPFSIELVFMTMCRKCVRRSGQFHLIGTAGHEAVACLQPAEYLHVLAVVGTQGDELLAVALLVQLQVDIEAALFFGQGRTGHADDTLHRAGQQVNLDEGAGHHVAAVVELEGHGDVVAAFA